MSVPTYEGEPQGECADPDERAVLVACADSDERAAIHEGTVVGK